MASPVSYSVVAKFTPLAPKPEPDTRSFKRKALEGAGSLLWSGTKEVTKLAYSATKLSIKGGAAYFASTVAAGYVRQVGMNNIPLLNYGSNFISCSTGNKMFHEFTGLDLPGCGGLFNGFTSFFVFQKEEVMIQTLAGKIGFDAADYVISRVEHVAQKGYNYVAKMIFTTPEEPAKEFTIALTEEQVKQLLSPPPPPVKTEVKIEKE